MFADRVDAGRRLAERLRHLAHERMVVLGLPRGGVPVAAEVAHALATPLDVILVRKLGVPLEPEWAMGSIAEGGVRSVDDDIVARAGVSADDIEAVAQREQLTLDARVARIRSQWSAVPLDGVTAIVVDDGLATGATARVACLAARARGARRVVLAVPVAPHRWEQRMGDTADEYVAVAAPRRMSAVGWVYRDFRPTSDAEVDDLLRRAVRRDGGP